MWVLSCILYVTKNIIGNLFDVTLLLKEMSILKKGDKSSMANLCILHLEREYFYDYS